MRDARRLLTILVVVVACTENSATEPPIATADPGATLGIGNARSGIGDDRGGHGVGASITCAPDNGGIALPPGFCATIFADHLGKARHIAVTPSGHVFVAIEPTSPTANDGHIASLFDADNDGVAEQQQTFGDIGGNGIAWHAGQLYLAANDRIVRFAVPTGSALPTAAASVTVASGLAATGDHPAKTIVFLDAAMYVNFGSASNACQIANREPHSPGKDPCDELPTRAGIWRFDATATDQTMSCGTRIATGMRNTNAMAIDPNTKYLWGAINGRDQLHDNWPELFTEAQDQQLPSDEVAAISPGLDRGWPYCYHDAAAREMKLAPEYGGDGTLRGRCASLASPDVALAAHSAPLALVFATGAQFPAPFRSGAFIANHGSRFDATASAGDLHGYDVEFVAFHHGWLTGDVVKFATGFDAGMRPLPDAAPHRPVGLAMMPDGSLLISDDTGGRIWRVFYTGR
jgi:glucose/arabinose dehydrogenase